MGQAEAQDEIHHKHSEIDSKRKKVIAAQKAERKEIRKKSVDEADNKEAMKAKHAKEMGGKHTRIVKQHKRESAMKIAGALKNRPERDVKYDNAVAQKDELTKRFNELHKTHKEFKKKHPHGRR